MRSLVLATMLALPVPAMAATVTVTFDDADIGTDGEVAYLASEGFIAPTATTYWDGDSIVLHDDGGIGTSMIVRQDGAAFTPVSMDLTLASRYLRSGAGPMPDMEADFEAFADWCDDGLPLMAGFRFTGLFAGGKTTVLDVVATEAYSATRLTFGAAFAGIMALTAEIVYPATVGLTSQGRPDITQLDEMGVIASGQDWCIEYCSVIRLDDLVVDTAPAPVPLPATAILLGAALLPMIRRRRR